MPDADGRRYYEPNKWLQNPNRLGDEASFLAERISPLGPRPTLNDPISFYCVAERALSYAVQRVVTYDTTRVGEHLGYARELLGVLHTDGFSDGLAIDLVHDRLMGWSNLALLDWLVGHPGHDCSESDSLIRTYYAHEPPKGPYELSLGLYRGTCCGAHQAVLNLFEQFRPNSVPKPGCRPRYSDQLAYMASASLLDRRYTTEQVRNAAKHVFDREMDEWLGRGHAVTAAQWLKIIYSDLQPSLGSPPEVILKCYDHLPEKTRQEAEQLRLGIQPKRPWWSRILGGD